MENIIGKKFNRLTVLKEFRDTVGRYPKLKCLCKCDCGNKKVINRQDVRSGNTKSCGCLLKEINSNKEKYGVSRTRQYHIWQRMKDRCYNKNNNAYKNYGGRGIIICKRWKNSFNNFWEDMKDGYKDNLSIDRIDNDGNYCKENCRWAGVSTQNRNARHCIYLTYKGEKKHICDWADKLNKNCGTLITRYKRGWNTKDIIERKIQKHDRVPCEVE